jgi:hypothetical protein
LLKPTYTLPNVPLPRSFPFCHLVVAPGPEGSRALDVPRGVTAEGEGADDMGTGGYRVVPLVGGGGSGNGCGGY